MNFFLFAPCRKKEQKSWKKKRVEKKSFKKIDFSHLDVLVRHLVQQEQHVRLLRVHRRVVEPARDRVLDGLARRLRLGVDLRCPAPHQRERGDGDRQRALGPRGRVFIVVISAFAVSASRTRLQRRPGGHEPSNDRREELEQQNGFEPNGLIREDHLGVRHGDVGKALDVYVAARARRVVVELRVLFGFPDLLVRDALAVEDDDVLVRRLLDGYDFREGLEDRERRGHEVAERDAADALGGAVREGDFFFLRSLGR